MLDAPGRHGARPTSTAGALRHGLPVLLAIPESEVVRDPAVIRGTVCLWRLHGYEVIVVTDTHRAQVQAVLGDRVEYVERVDWLDGVVWVGR